MQRNRANRRGSSSARSRAIQIESISETPFGALARLQWRKRLFAGMVGVLLIAAAALLYFQFRPANPADRPDHFPVALRCTVCGHDETRHVPHTQVFPQDCTSCGQRAARPLWLCHDCGETFLPLKATGTVRCAECSSENVGSAAVKPTIQPVGP